MKIIKNKISNPKIKYLSKVSYIFLELGLFCVLLWTLFNSKFIWAFLIGITWIVIYFGPALISEEKEQEMRDI
jgi:hypothetical protein